MVIVSNKKPIGAARIMVNTIWRTSHACQLHYVFPPDSVLLIP